MWECMYYVDALAYNKSSKKFFKKAQTPSHTWLVSTGVGVNVAWLKVMVGPSRSLAAACS